MTPKEKEIVIELFNSIVLTDWTCMCDLCKDNSMCDCSCIQHPTQKPRELNVRIREYIVDQSQIDKFKTEIEKL